jgi:hypothetical protein
VSSERVSDVREADVGGLRAPRGGGPAGRPASEAVSVPAPEVVAGPPAPPLTGVIPEPRPQHLTQAATEDPRRQHGSRGQRRITAFRKASLRLVDDHLRLVSVPDPAGVLRVVEVGVRAKRSPAQSQVWRQAGSCRCHPPEGADLPSLGSKGDRAEDRDNRIDDLHRLRETGWRTCGIVVAVGKVETQEATVGNQWREIPDDEFNASESSRDDPAEDPNRHQDGQEEWHTEAREDMLGAPQEGNRARLRQSVEAED